MQTATRPTVAARLLVAAMTAAVLTASCTAASTDHRAGSRPTSTAATTTTGIPPTSAGNVPTGGCTTPTLAARAVVTAWMAGDRSGAGRCATRDAVATLFAHPGRGAGWTFQGCAGPDPGVPVCTFAYTGGLARMTLQGTEAAGWSVDHVQLGAA